MRSTSCSFWMRPPDRGRGTETDGVSDDEAFAVGLTCGGIIDIRQWIHSTEFPELAEIAAAVARGEPVAVATVIPGPAGSGRYAPGENLGEDSAHSGGAQLEGPARLHVRVPGLGLVDAAVLRRRTRHARPGPTGIRRYGEHGERRGDELSNIGRHAATPRLGTPRSGRSTSPPPVARVGKFLGYHATGVRRQEGFRHRVTVPRRRRGGGRLAASRFRATEVDARTVVCVLTHDPKFDAPLLEVALRTPRRASA